MVSLYLMAGYIFFSTLETFSYFILFLSIFRFNPKLYLVESITVSIMVSVLSYLIREEVGIKTTLFPFIAILVFVFFVKLVIKISFAWSIITATASYAIFILVQTGILLLLTNLGVISFDKAQNPSIDQFIGQVVTASALIFPSLYLFNKGYGYSREFDNLVFKGETVLTFTLIGLFLLLLGIIFIAKNLILAFIALLILVIVLVIFGTKREKSYDFKNGI